VEGKKGVRKKEEKKGKEEGRKVKERKLFFLLK